MKELYDFTKWPFNLMLDIARYDRNQEDGNLSAEDEALSIPLLTLRDSIMETLSDRDADIIISLYKYGSTYASLANKYCITGGRISQIKGTCVRKLKEYIDRQQYIKAMTNTTASDVSGCNINDIPDSSKTPLKFRPVHITVSTK